jgi:hypothetical protein
MKKILTLLASLLVCVPAWAFNNTVAVTPAVQLAAYAAGSALGNLQTVPIFLPNSRYSGRLNAVWMANKAGAILPVTFYIFERNPTTSTCTDKVAFVLSAADVDKLAFAPFTMTPAVTTGTTVTTAQNLLVHSVRNKDVPLTNNLYMCAVVGGAGVTPASASDYIIKLNGEFD